MFYSENQRVLIQLHANLWNSDPVNRTGWVRKREKLFQRSQTGHGGGDPGERKLEKCIEMWSDPTESAAVIQYDGKMLTTLEKYFIKCAVTAEQTGAIHGTVLKQNYEKGSSKNTDYCISHSCDITLSPSPPTIHLLHLQPPHKNWHVQMINHCVAALIWHLQMTAIKIQ